MTTYLFIALLNCHNDDVQKTKHTVTHTCTHMVVWDYLGEPIPETER